MLVILGQRPGYRGVMLVILGQRPGYRGVMLIILGYHRVDSGADSGKSHCFMALMSGACEFMNDERLLKREDRDLASLLVGQADEPYGDSVSSCLVLAVDPHI